MDASRLTPDSPLPDDVPTLQALVRQLLAEVAELRAKLDAALKHRFGRRSERRAPVPLPKKGGPAASGPHGRSALPAHLERRVVVQDGDVQFRHLLLQEFFVVSTRGGAGDLSFPTGPRYSPYSRRRSSGERPMSRSSLTTPKRARTSKPPLVGGTGEGSGDVRAYKRENARKTLPPSVRRRPTELPWASARAAGGADLPVKVIEAPAGKKASYFGPRPVPASAAGGSPRRS